MGSFTRRIRIRNKCVIWYDGEYGGLSQGSSGGAWGPDTRVRVCYGDGCVGGEDPFEERPRGGESFVGF